MSFSGEVKSELMSRIPSAGHCLRAELRAFYMLLGTEEAPGLYTGPLRTESDSLESLLFTLYQKAFNIVPVVTRTENRRRGHGELRLIDFPASSAGEAARRKLGVGGPDAPECCRRAFLRGAFLAAGSLSDPEKAYHLEIVCGSRDTAECIRDTMCTFGLSPRIVLRKKDHVVYLKEGDQIVTLLGEMGGSNSFLSIESVRVMKEMRGSVNRIVNCETANLNKTVVSAVRQIEDIRYIKDHGGFGDLPDALREMAEVRLAWPDAPLAELGQHLDPVIGKSGVNHRLRKLSSIADRMRSL